MKKNPLRQSKVPARPIPPLKLAMLTTGTKLVEFARAARVTPSELSQYLGGYASPRVIALVELAAKKYFPNTRLSA